MTTGNIEMPKPESPPGARTCRECGCWDFGACDDEETGPCYWVGPDLCSHCVEPTRTPEQEEELDRARKLMYDDLCDFLDRQGITPQEWDEMRLKGTDRFWRLIEIFDEGEGGER